MNVTFEQQIYTVVESEGSVAVCAVVLGEFQRPVEVTMFTVDGSAQSKRTNQFSLLGSELYNVVSSMQMEVTLFQHQKC